VWTIVPVIPVISLAELYEGIYYSRAGRTSRPSITSWLIRTCVIVITLTGFVHVTGNWSNPFELRAKSWRFLEVSGLATRASWVCYGPALQERVGILLVSAGVLILGLKR
jgi:uncharacterized membrane protein